MFIILQIFGVETQNTAEILFYRGSRNFSVSVLAPCNVRVDHLLMDQSPHKDNFPVLRDQPAAVIVPQTIKPIKDGIVVGVVPANPPRKRLVTFLGITDRIGVAAVHCIEALLSMRKSEVRREAPEIERST